MEVNNSSLLYREEETETLRQIVRRHFPGEELAKAALITGGLFNTTYRLDLSDGGQYVLRLGPVNRRLLMPFEHGMMAAEAYAYDLCRPAGIPVPEVIAVSDDREIVDRDYMITAYIPSVPLYEAGGDSEDLLVSFGESMGKLHEIRGNRFGRVSQILRGGGYDTWGKAMLGELADWKTVGEPAGFFKPDELAAAESVFSRAVPLLDEITVPRLVHADLWAGNVLVKPEKTLGAVIDMDRCFFGDPAVESFGWFRFDGIRKGYENVRGAQTEDEHTALRRKLYSLWYAMLDGYVWKFEYRNDENSRECHDKAAALTDELNRLLDRIL